MVRRKKSNREAQWPLPGLANMAAAVESSALADIATGAPDGPAHIVSKKFKASDLPLTSATRSAIEGLAHSFKKKGDYDEIRKQVWKQFEESVCLVD